MACGYEQVADGRWGFDEPEKFHSLIMRWLVTVAGIVEGLRLLFLHRL